MQPFASVSIPAMSLAKRDAAYHTYAEYLTWPADVRYELIVCDESKLDERGMRGAPDWIVEVLSQATAVHDQTIKLAAYERAGVREAWLVHPTDRAVTVYGLHDRAFGRPAIHETKGVLAVEAIAGPRVDWDRVIE